MRSKMKKILLCCVCVVLFVACNNPKDSHKSQNQEDTIDTLSKNPKIEHIFDSLESQFGDPLPIIASIVLKIDAISNIDKVLESQEFQDASVVSKYKLYADYHTMLNAVKNDDWNAPLKTTTISAISAYLMHLNIHILQQDSLCQSFDKHYRDSKNIEVLHILDNSMLDEASAKKSLSQREANLNLITNDKELGILMIYLAKSFNELVLEKYQKQCRG